MIHLKVKGEVSEIVYKGEKSCLFTIRAGARELVCTITNSRKYLTLEQLMANETWLTANECVELGLADRIISSMDYGKGKEETKELLKQSTDIGHAVNNKQAALEGFIAAMIKAAQKRADENI